MYTRRNELQHWLTVCYIVLLYCIMLGGFGGLVVSMLTSGSRVRGFKPGRSRWIFRASGKSSSCLPSDGKWKNLSHVPALRHVKEPSTSVNYECASKIPSIVPSFASRGLSYLCGAWRLWRWMKGTHRGKGTIGLQAEVPKRPHTRPSLFCAQQRGLWGAEL